MDAEGFCRCGSRAGSQAHPRRLRLRPLRLWPLTLPCSWPPFPSVRRMKSTGRPGDRSRRCAAAGAESAAEAGAVAAAKRRPNQAAAAVLAEVEGDEDEDEDEDDGGALDWRQKGL